MIYLKFINIFDIIITIFIGRWRIFKSGIRVHGIEAADNIWFTCCALHNMLLNVDGLDKKWRKGVPSPFEGELGWHAVGDVETYAPLIFRIVRDGCGIRELDTSQFARGNVLCNTYLDNREEEIKNFKNSGEEKNYKILRMENKDFRDKLVTSFHRRWTVKDIVWPSR